MIASVTKIVIRISLGDVGDIISYNSTDQNQFSDAGDSISYTNCDQDQLSDA